MITLDCLYTNLCTPELVGVNVLPSELGTICEIDYHNAAPHGKIITDTLYSLVTSKYNNKVFAPILNWYCKHTYFK